jgi:hypothetical protein
MAKKIEFDWKNFLLQRGERVGLYVALGVMALMLILGLFWPNSGLFGESATKKAQELAKLNDAAKRALANNQPAQGSEEASREVPKELIKVAGIDPAKAAEFRTDTALFAPFAAEDNKRHTPDIEEPTEWHPTIVLAAVQSFMFTDGGKKIGVVERKEAKEVKKSRRQQQLEFLLNRRVGLGQGRGGVNPGQMMGNMGMPPGGGGGPRGGSGSFGGGMMPQSFGQAGSKYNFDQFRGKQEKQIVFEDLDTVGKKKDLMFAHKPMPLHIVVWEASFPMRQQLEKFKKALHLGSLADAKNELKFEGFEVQRREMGPDGNFEKWSATLHRLPVAEPYKGLLVLSGRDLLRPEDEKIDKELLTRGLYMPLLKQLKGKDYDKVFDARMENLTKLVESINELKKKSKDEGPQPVKSDEFKEGSDAEVFGGEAEPTTPDPKKSPDGKDPKQGATGYDKNWEPPEYCLLRFIDVMALPGKTYQYRVRIKVANPNYNYADPKKLMNDSVAVGKVLLSSWIELPDTVTVPPDFNAYCVDQREIDPNDPMAGPKTLKSKDQAVVQLQTWLEQLAPGSGTPYPVGDWAIAPRVLVNRGEYLGGALSVKLPVWDAVEDDYILAKNPGVKNSKTMSVEFSTPDASPLLVHLDGGKALYVREVQKEDAKKPEVTRVEDKEAATEMLLLTADGKLIVKNSTVDKKNKQRADNYKQWKKVVKYVEAKDLPPDPRKPKGDEEDPFKKGKDKDKEKEDKDK